MAPVIGFIHWHTLILPTGLDLRREFQRRKQTDDIKERAIRRNHPFAPPFPSLPPEARPRTRSSAPPISRLLYEHTTGFVFFMSLRTRLELNANDVQERKNIPSPLNDMLPRSPPYKKQNTTPANAIRQPSPYLKVMWSSLKNRCAKSVAVIIWEPLSIEQWTDDV